MKWPLVKLSAVAPSKPLKNPNINNTKSVWQLNLDKVESHSGQVSKKVYDSIELAGSSTHWFDERHVLYSKLRPYLNKVVLPDEQGLATTELVPLCPDESRLDRKYLAYYLRSEHFVSWISDQVAGAKMPRVSMKVFWEHEIPLPPVEEQKRIAKILDKADLIRCKRQQTIKLADDFLRSIFLDMFGADLQRNENVIKFGDVSILDAKMVDPREEEYLDLLHIGPDRIEKNTGKLLRALTAREEGLISKKFLFDEQYILYSKIRPYLRKVALPDFRALCSADMYPIKPVQEKVTREFIWMLLLSDFFDNYVSTLPARANIPKLNKTELAEFEFSLPDFSKIAQFTEIVKRYFAHSIAISDSQVESKYLFNSLSQRAFAGDL
ncbi:restriction endonuclease subunit S [Shewanella sp. OPT22]|nr:restriction endonuclease subunit S [Shewanella sp. OPT22]